MNKNMMRSLIILAVILLVDLYVFQGVKVLLSNAAASTKQIVYAMFWGITAYALFIIVLNMFLDLQLWPKQFKVYSVAFVLITYISKLLFVVFLLMDDFLRLIRWIISLFYQKEAVDGISTNATEANGITRLEFFSKAGLIAGAIPFFSLIYGMVRGPYRYEIKKLKLHFPKLPQAFEGLKIVQLSDIHIGSFSGPKHIERAIGLIHKQKPDIILFTGDLVNDKASETDGYFDFLKQITAPMGVYSVLGNHDYGDYFKWPSLEEKAANLLRLKDFQKQLGWKLLMNEHVILERGQDKIALIGIENWSNLGNFPKYGKMDQAVKGLPEVPVQILLSHDPTHWEAQVLKSYPDIDLALAGHTHGLQFGIEIPGFKWSPAQYIYKQWAGLYQKGKQYIYVNRGFGFLGYPGRVGIMPEITVIELSNKATV
jgi:predicted MPP superfamily phosphohydrolase